MFHPGAECPPPADIYYTRAAAHGKGMRDK